MEINRVRSQRLVNQQLAGSRFKKPEDLVRFLGAIQAQVYQMSKWAVGLRLGSSSDAEIESALNSGRIIRTHILRPTWHLVHPEDLRWMLKLTAPRVHAFNAYMYRQQALDEKLLRKTDSMICKMLEGERFQTRASVKVMLETKGIKTDTVRLSCIMMHAELEGLICSGPRTGKQFTYALFEERISSSRDFDKDESLAELAKIYFRSRGPASAKDFTWWSGLTAKDVNRSIDMLKPMLKTCDVNGTEMYYFEQRRLAGKGINNSTFLMPDFDEYAISYSSREVMHGNSDSDSAKIKKMSDFNRWIIHKGIIAGKWDPPAGKNILPTIELFSKVDAASLKKASERYMEFQNKPN